MLSFNLRAVSSLRDIHQEFYSALCTRLNLFLASKLQWVSITPSLHKHLAHSAELIQTNDGCGLEAFSEEGMDADNKRLRQIRTELSWKTSQKTT